MTSDSAPPDLADVDADDELLSNDDTAFDAMEGAFDDDEFDDELDLDDVLDDDLDDVLDDDPDDDDEEAAGESAEVLAALELGDDDDTEVVPVLESHDAFDDLRDLAADGADGTDDEVHDGEFICRSCFMAKKETTMADEDRLLCNDCV